MQRGMCNSSARLKAQ